MKKILWVLCLSVLLCGCGRDSADPTESVTLPQEPTTPWVYESGTAWDDAGALLEVPTAIPGGVHYVNSMEFDGDLLLWNTDSHKVDKTVLEMAVFDLDTGTCTAQRDHCLPGFPVPQVLDDTLYICDNSSGVILQLDKELNEINRWETEPDESSWYMGTDGKLYQYRDYEYFWVRDLNDGSEKPVIEGNPVVTYVYDHNDVLALEFFRADTGARIQALLDLQTGEIIMPEIYGRADTLSFNSGHLMVTTYSEGYVHYLHLSDDDVMRIDTKGSVLNLLDEDRLLLTDENGEFLRLYDLQGNAIGECCISENGNYYALDPIWCESLNGYFLQVEGFTSDQRLLFWHIGELDSAVPALAMEPDGAPSDDQLELTRRAQELSEKYGIDILVGEQCEERFTDFTAKVTTDYYAVNNALDILDAALSDYPKGFLAQLKCDSFRGVQIQLVTNLTADGGGREGEGYAAFTELMWSYYLMVVDIEDSDESTYYHEFSHIIDSYLDWDSYQREDALFSEAAWASLNPEWFDGYTYDYALEREVKEYGYFVDSYCTINPTEDRARVLEYAMCDYGVWTFEDAKGLTAKLDYYCRCIRQAFDTTGWPEVVRWEQYLNKGIG